MDLSWSQIAWLLVSVLALSVAVVFVFVTPKAKIATGSGWQQWVLRWGHAAVWLLLALSFASQAFGFSAGLFAFMLMALAMSLLFGSTLLRS